MDNRSSNQPWESDTFQLGFEEELSIKLLGGRVEGKALESRVNIVGSGDGVSGVKLERKLWSTQTKTYAESIHTVSSSSN